MTSRWFNVTVVVFWLTTMGWLVQEKILPTLIVGNPPSYRTLAEDAEDHAAPVGWTISLNDRPLGWAISRVQNFAPGGHEFRSRIRLSRVPLAAMTPNWVSSFVRMLQRAGDLPDLRLEVDATTTLAVDPLGRPLVLNSLATIGHATNGRIRPGDLFNIRMDGRIEGQRLHLTVKSGELSYETTAYLPMDALMGDALSPQARLPGLRIGQKWTTPVYSPFRSPSSPLEVLQASVQRREEITWNDEITSTLVVVFARDAGGDLSSGEPQGRAWVANDGRVLRQELNLGTTRLGFERVGAEPPPVPAGRKRKLADIVVLRPWWSDVFAPPLVTPPTDTDTDTDEE
ncbi:MAG TPA: hypothetical protein VHV77_11915 [Pirellulales bacterium]|jgi:hypothetical protein|nr:hypothetical protein [Pirellulales bacterium]